MHVFAEYATDMSRATIHAGTHGESVEVAHVTVANGAHVVELLGVAATVDAARLLEALAMATEVLPA
jgi:hypothetical protein